jgi:endonuclease/exonuclease/phosphatase (EEP) superfamily protein YafD
MRNLKYFILIGAVILLVASTISFLPLKTLPIDLLSHFRLQYFAAAIIGILICLWKIRTQTRARIATGIFICSAILNGWALVPYLPSGNVSTSTNGSIKIAVANIYTKNQNHDAVLSFIRQEEPDLVLLIETNDRWVRAMAPLKNIYPYSYDIFRPQNFGMIVLSKKHMGPVETNFFTDSKNIVSLLFDLIIEDKKYSITAVHAAPPIGNKWFQRRNLHLQSVANLVSNQNGSTLVLGDLNTTPFSYSYKQFLKSSRLKDPRETRGYLPTWGPIELFPFRIPIDHILLSKDLEATSLAVGPDIGSDHRPLIAVIRPRTSSLSKK